MEWLIVILLVMMFASGAPLFAVILGFALLGDMWTARPFWQEVSNNVVDIISLGTQPKAETLVPIPLFIFAGYVLAESKTADRMVRAAKGALGFLPGGLAIVTIMACAVFTTFTGASGVTIVALGGLIMPSLLKEKYPERFSLGLVAGTGSVGLLFPPAVPLFVYATVYGWSYQGVFKENPEAIPLEMDRFIFAGIVPGMVLIGILMVYSSFVAYKNKVPRHKMDAGEFGVAMAQSIPEILLPLIIIGGLASGWGIPEISSIAVLYVLFIEMVVYRDIKPRDLIKITKESMALVGAIFIIIVAATALANTFVNADMPRKLVDLFTDNISTDKWWLFLLAVNLILLLAGMLMDIFSAILIIVPLLALPADKYGIDPYHLGVIFLLNLEIGYITPPVGLNLFITSLKFRKPMVDVTRATMPFLTCMVIALVLVTYIPALTVVPPAKPTGTIDVLTNIVKKKKRRLGAIEQLTLPDGTTMQITDCDKAKGELAQGKCETLFIEVTACRKQGGDEGKACEDGILKSWVEGTASVDDLSVEDLLKPTGDDDDDDAPDTLDGIGDGDDDDDAPDSLDDIEKALDGDDDDGDAPDNLDDLEKMLDDDDKPAPKPKANDDDEAPDNLEDLEKMLDDE